MTRENRTPQNSVAATTETSKTVSQKEALITAAENMDWMQPILNQSAPCFHLDSRDGHFCGRAERWDGHKAFGDQKALHSFVPLHELLRSVSK